VTQNLTLARQPSGANVRSAESGTVSLLDRDARWQIFNASSALTVNLPGDGAAGDVWIIENRGSGVLTLKSSDASTIATLNQNDVYGTASVQAAPTSSAHWRRASAVGYPSPSNLDDVAATRAGLKSYSHGITYNGGNAPTISLTTATGLAVQGSRFIPYQMQDGTWRMKFHWKMTHNSNTISDASVNGVTSVSFSQGVLLEEEGAVPQARGGMYWDASSGNLVLRPGTTAVTSVSVSGDVALASKPAWAY
jgi:hypothetical protein